MNIEPDKFYIMVVTVVQAQTPCVHTLIQAFDNRSEALDAVLAISEHTNAEGIYYQDAMPLFRN